MDGVTLTFGIMGLTILGIVLVIVCVVIGIVMLMTLWALVKPHIHRVIDKWWDWYSDRTN